MTIRTGQNLNRYLSKGILKDKADRMLLDWRISHLHLGPFLNRNSKFSERSGDLLYVLFDDIDAYIIGIAPHGKWTDANMLDKIEYSAANVLNRYLVPGASALPQHTNPTGSLRDSNINCLTELKSGKLYFSMGHGITGGGHSSYAYHAYQNIINNHDTAAIDNVLSGLISFRKAW